MKEENKEAIYTYSRKLRTAAFELEHGPNLNEIIGTAAEYLGDTLNELLLEGQRIEVLVATEGAGEEAELPAHDSSALVSEPLPQVFYQAAELLNEATTA